MLRLALAAAALTACTPAVTTKHTSEPGPVAATDADAALRGAANARATLLAGFTTVRNVGGGLADRSLRDAITGVFAHGSNAREFVTLTKLGIPAMDVIVAATRSAADLLGLASLGRIEVGYIADLVVVDGDPLTDIHALGRPSLVIQGGQFVRPPTWP